MAAGVAIGWLFIAGWMIWDSKVGKLWARDRLLDGLKLRGDELVLDVGCGRGLLLIGAAKRLTTGKAIGVDIWNAEDLSGNRPEATLENTRLEGAAERVEVKDGDTRWLPFADGAFDVIVSKEVLHNIGNATERDTAVRRSRACSGRAAGCSSEMSGTRAGTCRCFGSAAWRTCAVGQSRSPPCSSAPSVSASPTRPT